MVCNLCILLIVISVCRHTHLYTFGNTKLKVRGSYLSLSLSAYLHHGDLNVILVDWVQARRYSYTVAARVTEYVGVMCARLVRELDADLSLLHVVGFGLGAVSSVSLIT